MSVEYENVNVGSGVRFADQTAVRQTAEPVLPSVFPMGRSSASASTVSQSLSPCRKRRRKQR